MTDSNQSPNTPVGSNEVPPATLNPSEKTQQIELPPNEISPANSDTQDVIERSSPNKRGLTLEAWTHFKRQKIDDKWKAIYKYCDRKLGGDTRQGTKHLHDHIRTCKLRTVRGRKQSIIRTLAQSSANSAGERGESFVLGDYTFNQDIARMELVKMTILHEYPLSIVDHIRFRRFCGSL
ncbi:hypothetical protein CDL12_21846 [Handroanthus impetiginosus]|uniref:BED-type domain-containing protein n=1 Tax=Handroanthus impetiginosus TaxID=429701 RepID=A0A2G9GK79_9LAMI|nr:hypothetical protein CDL12_21846 [Handroanthus impetiginosus]